MKLISLLGFMFVVTPVIANASQDIQRSHIEGNVPPQMMFDSYLKRDLTSYFAKVTQSEFISIEYKMLRDGPTQSGVAYPKYYLTLKVLDKGRNRQMGAVRVAAIDKVRFEITDFVSCLEANKSRDALPKVFPAGLIDGITAFCSES